MFLGITPSVFIPIIILAAIDSINPVELLAGIFLFTAKNPLKCFFFYVIGIFVFHFLLGFCFYYSFNYILSLEIFKSSIFDRSVELIGAVLLIIFGFRMKKSNKPRTDMDIRPAHVFLLGIMITASAIPTSASYYSALGIIARKNMAFGDISLLLSVYNFIFIAPLFVLLALYLLFGEYSKTIFGKIRFFISAHLNKLLKIVLVLAGLYLIFDFIRHTF